MPDVNAFLNTHGTALTYLDLNTIPGVNVSGVLVRCPLLTSFAFNPHIGLP